MGFLVNSFLNVVASAFDPDAQAYFDTLEGAGFPLDAAGKDWVNNRVLNLKGNAAGSITTEALNIWDNIRLLVFYQYNAGAGSVAYAVKGGNGTDAGTPAWSASGFTPSATFAHGLSAPIDIGVGQHTGISMNSRFTLLAYQNFTVFANIDGTSLRHRMSSGNNLEFRYGTTFTFGGFLPAVYDFQWTAYDLTGQSDGTPHKAQLFDGTTLTAWTDFGTLFNLPQASNSQSSIDLAANQRYEMESFILTAQELTNVQSDNVQAILNAIT